MNYKYSVTCRGQHVGIVYVQKEGLYYHFSCCCSISKDIMYRLIVDYGNSKEHLGILVPKGNDFVLEKKVPAKRVSERNMIFELIPKHVLHAGTFVPISPTEPFSYISSLKKSFLGIQNETLGIVL